MTARISTFSRPRSQALLGIALILMSVSISLAAFNVGDTVQAKAGYGISATAGGNTVAITIGGNQGTVLAGPVTVGINKWYNINWSTNPDGWSTDAAMTLVSSTPTAPSGLAAVATETLVSLAWYDNSNNETGFKVERKTGSGGSWSQIATTGQNIAAHIDHNVTAGVTYYYRVRAYNSSGNSGYSGETSATPQVPLPAAPGYLEAQAFSTRVELGWTDNSNNETGFKIERRTGSGSWSQIGTIGANSGNSAYYTDNTVATRTTYSYRVRAYNSAGDSGYGPVVSLTTPGGKPGAFTLSNDAPVWDPAIPGPKVQLNWTASADVGNYAVYRNGTVYASGISGTTYLNSANLTGGATYTYFIRASNADGTTDTDIISVTMPNGSQTGPTAPSGLAAFPTATLVSLAWSDNSPNETGFKIERKTGAAGTWTQIGTTGPDVAAFIDGNVAGGVTYVYRVRAFNASGDSSYCGEIYVTMPASALHVTLASPNGGESFASGTSLPISWSVGGNASAISFFFVEYSLTGGSSWSPINNVYANGSDRSTTWSIPAAMATTQGRVRVQAFNVSGSQIAVDMSDANFMIADTSVQLLILLKSTKRLLQTLCNLKAA